MSLHDWLQNTTGRLRRDGLSGAIESGQLLYNGAWRIGCSRIPLGQNIYSRDWDVLILLDGCRVDLLQEQVGDYAFIESVDSIRSVGSSSREWLAKTFTPQYRESVEKTAYVTANPYTDEILSPGGAKDNSSPFNPANWGSLRKEDFHLVEEVWKKGWDDDLGTVPPRSLTDRAISVSRELDPERLIIHYMQPHQPFIPAIEDEPEIATWLENDCWTALRRGDVSREEVWSAYRENLGFVLDDVSLLLKNIDAGTAVISSDHGNAFGEWGMYGHPNGFLHPVVKRVPWVVTSASDTGEHRPEKMVDQSPEMSVDDRLKNLGYL